MLTELKLETLHEFDEGRAALGWQQALRRAVADVRDRPHVDRPRKVTLVAELVPKLDATGSLESVGVVFEVKESVPARKTNEYPTRCNPGALLFNPLAPDDPDQRTIDELAEFEEGGEL